MNTAVVFAYHNVGVRCLSVLLAHGVDVLLVLTHEDDPAEQIWFDSVSKLAALRIQTKSNGWIKLPVCNLTSFFLSTIATC